MRKSIILAALIVAAVTSCQKEYMQETGDIVNFSIKATREACDDSDANTRATVSADGKFSWSAGDVIGIWNGSSFQKLTTKDSGETATFTGLVEGTLSDYAIYPSTVGKSVSSGSVTVTLPTSYEWKEGEVNAPMLATYDAKSLSFKYLGGVVVVTLKSVPKNATKFVFWTDKDITGDYTVNSDGEIKSAGSDSNKEVTFTFSITKATDMVFYVPVPVGDYKFGFKLLDSADAEIGLQMQGTKVNKVARKDLMKMPEVTCTSVTGGGEGTTSSTSIPAGHNGTFYLPDTSSDVLVEVAGDCTSIDLVYGGSKPANVTINAAGYKIPSLAINLPESHVNVTGGEYTTVTSRTSLSTLVLDKTVKIADKLEVSEGSVEIACEVKDVVVNETVPVEAKIVLAPTAKITEKLTTTSSAAIVIPKNTEATGSEQSQAAITSIVVNAPTSTTTDYTAPVIDLQDGATSTSIEVTGDQSENVATVESTTKTTGESSAAGEEDKSIKAGSENALNYAIKNGSEVQLTADIAVKSAIRVGSKLVLDLNKKTLSADANLKDDAVIMVNRGGDLTITGDGIVDAGMVLGAIKLTEKTDAGTEAAKLTIENGTFKGYSYAITGNGSRHNTEVTINGGTFGINRTDDGAAIYHPQDGKLTIKGGSFVAAAAAIELRAGTLDISGGKFESTISPASVAPNGNGTTVVGAAIGISQHNTDKPINVKISGGEFTGVYSIWEKDVQNETARDQIKLSVTGGKFNGAVYSQNNPAFIAGGSFNHPSAINYNAAGNDLAVTLTADVNYSLPAILNNGTAELDLGGHTLTYSGGGANDYSGALKVLNGTLTVKGTGNIVATDDTWEDRMLFWAKGENSKIILNADANYTVGECTVAGKVDYYNVAYTNNSGAIEINNGRFELKSTNSKNILNINNTTKGTITVKGGTFVGYDPANGDDYFKVSFVAEGYASVETETGVWKVSAVEASKIVAGKDRI